MKKLKKAAMFSDIHFGKRNNSEEHNQDCLNFINWFCGQVRSDPEIDHIWFLGDWHEHRAAINAFTLQRSYHGAKMLNDLGLPIKFIVGNHDLAFRNIRTTFTTEIFEPLENFNLISEIAVLDDIYDGVLAIPYLREDEYPTILDYKKVPIVMGHLELKGFRVTGTGSRLEHGPEAETFFKHQKKVFSGHFHMRDSKGNVNYIGSPFCMDFSDVNDTERGMAVYDFVSDDLKYIDWPDGPQYITATLSEVLENPKKILKKGARVKIEVDDDITYDESNKIKERLASKYHLRDITLMEKMTIDVKLTDEEEAVEELQLETTNEIIQALIARIKDDSVDTDLLLKIYNSAKLSSGTDLSKAAHVEFMDMTMRNFLSYGNNVSSVNLNFAKPTMVMGRNYDSVVEGQVDSNGAGKSTILNALLLCLYGENLIKSKLDKQINRANGKNMMLTVTFKADGKYYKVERYRKNREAGGDGVRLYVNDKEPMFTKEHDKTPDSVSNCEAEIARIIGIPYEMFIRIVVFSATHQPFLSLPSSHASQANQRDIIEELFGLTELTLKADKIKELFSASKSEFKNLIDVNSRIEAEHGRHLDQVTANISRKDHWDQEHQERIEKIRAQLELCEAIDLINSIEGFEEVAKLEKELVKVEKNLPALQTEFKSVQSRMAKFSEWEIWNKTAIQSLQAQLEELRAIDIDYHRALNTEYDQLVKNQRAKNSERTLLKTQLKTVQDTIQRILSDQSKLKSENEHLNENECPYCHQKFADVMLKIKENSSKIEELQIEYDEFKIECDTLELTITVNYDDRTQIQNRLDEIDAGYRFSNVDEIQAERDIREHSLEQKLISVNPHAAGEDDLTEEIILESITNIQKKVDSIKSKIDMAKEFIHSSFKSMADVNGHQVHIEGLRKRINEIQCETNPFIVVIDSLNAQELESLKTDRINELDKEIKHQDFLIKLLTKKDSFIRKALLNKCLPLLNTRLRYYLDRVGLPHKVSFNEEMGVDISQFGSDSEYDLFSSGQKARVNICLAFAFRDVLQSRFGKTNLCILDECLDTGLGSVGVSLVAKMIKSIALENKLSMFVISHRDEISNMFDKRLEIELRNGFSIIMDDDNEQS